MKIRALLAILLVLCIAVFAFSACQKDPDPTPTPTPDGDPTPDPTPDDEKEPPVLDGDVLTLIYKGKVNFQIVKTTGIGGSEAVKKVTDLTAKLRELGLTVSDAVADNDAAAVKDCEIVIGAGAKNRGDDCNVDVHELGAEGYVVKVVGQRIVIAGGSDEKLCEAVDKFVSTILGVTDTTTSLKDATVSVKTDKVIKEDTYYDVADIRVGSKQTSLKKYYLSYDAQDTTVGTMANKIRNAVYAASGIWIPLEHEAEAGTEIKSRVIVRVVADAGEGAFRALVDDDDNLVVECSFVSGFEKGVDAFVTKYLVGKSGVVRFYEEEMYNYPVNVVRYTDFGAVGDGRTDDSLAILATHEYANANGMKVVEDAGLTYYLGEESFGIEIPIRTDVDFGKATFIIDDRKLAPDVVYGNSLGRNYDIFDISPSENKRSYAVNKSVYQGKSIDKDAVNASGNIGMTFDTDVMLSISYTGQKIYIRWGSNANNGGNTHEMVIVDKNGNLSPTTPMTYDYPRIDALYATPIDETPIVVKGGKFITYANQLWYEFTNPTYVTGDQYYYYARGMIITRQNVTVEGMEHYVEKEGNGGYPYNGWYNTNNCYNVLIKDCIATGHRAYNEDRDTDGDGQPNHDAGTTMGSYDLIGASAIDIKYQNVRQSNSITTTYYWGIMGSNYCRNITYEDCYLSRFDAHCGVYNATLKDTTIGFDINLIGHGEVLIENVTKMSGSSLISLRVDYGSTWNGTITIKNVKMYGYARGSFSECGTTTAYSDYYIVDGTWKDHEFGNECTLPNIIVDGFEIVGYTKPATLSLYAYYSLSAAAFHDQHQNYLELPEFVELRNVASNITVYYTAPDSIELDNRFAEGLIEDRTTGEKKMKLRRAK